MLKNNLTYQCFFIGRRNYLRESFIGASAGLLSHNEKKIFQAEIKPGEPAKVFLEGVRRGSSEDVIAEAVWNASLQATDFSWLSRGDSVLIKPANNSGEKYPATTHPGSVASMIKLLKEKGAGRVIVMDMAGIEHVKLRPDGLCGSTRELMKRNGLWEAVEKADGEIYLPEEEGWNAFFEDGPVSGSHWKNGIMVPKKLKEVDHIVLMPRVSRHPLAGATLGLKAAVGYIRFDSRLEYHRDARSFYEKHTEINTIPSIQNKLRLILSTATKVQTTFGPDNGYVVEPETGLIIASTSIVAHDMVALAWLIESRESTPEKEKKGARDPYATNSRLVSMLNSGVVFLLGGLKETIKTQRLQKYDISSVFNDPTLYRAFEIWGGAPKVELKDESASVPEQLRKSLTNRIILENNLERSKNEEK